MRAVSTASPVLSPSLKCPLSSNCFLIVSSQKTMRDQGAVQPLNTRLCLLCVKRASTNGAASTTRFFFSLASRSQSWLVASYSFNVVWALDRCFPRSPSFACRVRKISVYVFRYYINLLPKAALKCCVGPNTLVRCGIVLQRHFDVANRTCTATPQLGCTKFDAGKRIKYGVRRPCSSSCAVLSTSRPTERRYL